MRPFLRSLLVTILFLVVLAFTQSDVENILQVQPFASLMTLSLRERGASQILQGRYMHRAYAWHYHRYTVVWKPFNWTDVRCQEHKL